MKNLLKAFRRTLTGKNRTGQVVHGIVDILPIPNFLNLFRSVEAEQPDLNFWGVVLAVIRKGDTIRFLVSIPLSVAILAGWITLDTVKEFWHVVGEILTLFGG
jgi:hypothetical protein